jgi:hypothetical protein
LQTGKQAQPLCWTKKAREPTCARKLRTSDQQEQQQQTNNKEINHSHNQNNNKKQQLSPLDALQVR